MRGKGDARRCEAIGSKKPEAYSLEYGEDFFEPRMTQMPEDRLPQQNGITRTDSYGVDRISDSGKELLGDAREAIRKLHQWCKDQAFFCVRKA